MSREYKFWGHEWVSDDIKELYDDFSKAWCAETCAPRMRCDWSEDNKTLGQCSITSFIVSVLGPIICPQPSECTSNAGNKSDTLRKGFFIRFTANNFYS